MYIHNRISVNAMFLKNLLLGFYLLFIESDKESMYLNPFTIIYIYLIYPLLFYNF